MAAYVAAFNLGTGITGPLFLVYAVRRLGLSPASSGSSSCSGTSAGSSAPLIARRADRSCIGIGRTLAGRGALGGAPLFLLPLAPHDLAIRVLVASGALTVVRDRPLQHPGISLYQTLVPERILGRMNASRRWIVWGMIPLGNLLGGVLASRDRPAHDALRRLRHLDRPRSALPAR